MKINIEVELGPFRVYTKTRCKKGKKRSYVHYITMSHLIDAETAPRGFTLAQKSFRCRMGFLLFRRGVLSRSLSMSGSSSMAPTKHFQYTRARTQTHTHTHTHTRKTVSPRNQNPPKNEQKLSFFPQAQKERGRKLLEEEEEGAIRRGSCRIDGRTARNSVGGAVFCFSLKRRRTSCRDSWPAPKNAP